MTLSRRTFANRVLRGLAVACLVPAAGCSGGGPLSGEPKKYEGGGPLPEMKGEETPEPSSAKAKTKKR